MASEFVITAWWPPTISSTDEHADTDQLQEYKAAHFNLVLTGNVVGFCQHFNATPTPATANEALDCVIGALERVDAFLSGVLDACPTETLVLVVSDHGNIEDVRVGHTKNPALGLATGTAGELVAAAAERLRDIRDVTPFVLDLLDAGN